MHIPDPRLRFALLAVAIVVIAGAILAIERPWQPVACSTNAAGSPDLCGEVSWFNSEPLSLQELEGEVVLVDFWTYSCINCIRTLPHLTALYDTYEPYGFLVVGVHTPEFRFEKDPDNVQAAIDKHGIHYPVVQDNDYRIWDNYHNRYWPAHYLMDHTGELVYTHFGEGAYAETESRVRELLVAAGATELPPPIETEVDDRIPQADVTHEIYAGFARQPDAIGNPEGYRPDQVVAYTATDAAERDKVYFDGAWHNGPEAMRAEEDGAFLLRFRAGAANMVVSPGAADGACLVVLLDGAPIPEDLRGPDVHEGPDGPCVLLAGDDSYDLYSGPVEEHVLEVQAPVGLALYTFAFSSLAYG